MYSFKRLQNFIQCALTSIFELEYGENVEKMLCCWFIKEIMPNLLYRKEQQ